MNSARLLLRTFSCNSRKTSRPAISDLAPRIWQYHRPNRPRVPSLCMPSTHERGIPRLGGKPKGPGPADTCCVHRPSASDVCLAFKGACHTGLPAVVFVVCLVYLQIVVLSTCWLSRARFRFAMAPPGGNSEVAGRLLSQSHKRDSRTTSKCCGLLMLASAPLCSFTGPPPLLFYRRLHSDVRSRLANVYAIHAPCSCNAYICFTSTLASCANFAFLSAQRRVTFVPLSGAPWCQNR